MKYEQPYGTGTSHIAVEGSIYNSIDAFMYYLLFNAARPHARDCIVTHATANMPNQTDVAVSILLLFSFIDDMTMPISVCSEQKFVMTQ